MIRLNEVGAFVSAPTRSGMNVTFGLYLPGIGPQAGYEAVVRVQGFEPELYLHI
jgi:hypothetical protein